MNTKSKKNKKQKLPKWFNGDIYSSGDIVTNPFSGQEYELTAEELSMYDLIKGLKDRDLICLTNLDIMYNEMKVQLK